MPTRTGAQRPSDNPLATPPLRIPSPTTPAPRNASRAGGDGASFNLKD